MLFFHFKYCNRSRNGIVAVAVVVVIDGVVIVGVVFIDIATVVVAVLVMALGGGGAWGTAGEGVFFGQCGCRCCSGGSSFLSFF